MLLIYLLLISVFIYVIGRIYPRKYIFENAFPFNSFAFERQGKIYDKINIKNFLIMQQKISCYAIQNNRRSLVFSKATPFLLQNLRYFRHKVNLYHRKKIKQLKKQSINWKYPTPYLSHPKPFRLYLPYRFYLSGCGFLRRHCWKLLGRWNSLLP